MIRSRGLTEQAEKLYHRALELTLKRAQGEADIREVIGYLKTRGIGILITDHNVRETLDIIDRAKNIHAGEVLFEGSPD